MSPAPGPPRRPPVVLAVGTAVAFGLLACREEPIITIRFEPRDAAAAPRGAPRPPPPRPDAPPTPERPPTPAELRCELDGDCVMVKGDCCGCSAGGKAATVAATAERAYEAKLASECSHAMCIQVMSTHPTCRMVASCQAGRCQLVPPTVMPRRELPE